MYTSNGRKFTMKRGIAEWFNEDCPDIYDDKGNRIFHTDISQTNVQKGMEEPIYSFIKSSHDLFCRKYNYENTLPDWIKKIRD